MGVFKQRNLGPGTIVLVALVASLVIGVSNFDAATGRVAKPLEVTGTASYRRGEGEDGETSELEATRDAAEKAAKKLPGLLKK